jgi:hypothetical protein
VLPAIQRSIAIGVPPKEWRTSAMGFRLPESPLTPGWSARDPSREGKNDTAWNCRDATWSMVIAGIDPNPQMAGSVTRWTKAYWEAVHPFNLGGAYPNFMMDDEGESRLRVTYGDNYPRLATAKTRYDPGNLFRVNQNIRPSS